MAVRGVLREGGGRTAERVGVQKNNRLIVFVLCYEVNAAGDIGLYAGRQLLRSLNLQVLIVALDIILYHHPSIDVI